MFNRVRPPEFEMMIIRDIVTDFSDDEEIELCDDDDIETTEPGSITYANIC
ncbi:unnamed protein product [Lupinus luteus]|uniref:Uncharacterized protein n=1 Tax=Lupinus luteus TaxID=3873 RepID=A0AAV1YEK6_LUPLU